MARVTTEHFEDGKFFINHYEDVEPLLDHLKEQRNHHDRNAYKKNDARWRHIGSIPMNILDMWMKENPPFNALKGDAETTKEVIRRLERDYPALLAVDKL
jgi:hypothetical protein